MALKRGNNKLQALKKPQSVELQNGDVLYLSFYNAKPKHGLLVSKYIADEEELQHTQEEEDPLNETIHSTDTVHSEEISKLAQELGWQSNHEFYKYVELFVKEGFTDVAGLRKLKEEHLKDLGIAKMAHRMQITDHIKSTC